MWVEYCYQQYSTIPRWCPLAPQPCLYANQLVNSILAFSSSGVPQRDATAKGLVTW